MLNTVRSNNNVGGLPYSYTFLAQLSELIRALYSHPFPQKLEYGKFLQQALGNFIVLFVPKPLKYLGEYQIANSNCAIAEGAVEKIGFCRVVADEVVNPDTGIYKDHEERLISSRSPDHSSLPLNRLIPSCFFSLIRVLSPCSTASFLVFRPVAFS